MENNNKKSLSFISDIFYHKNSDIIFPIIKNSYKIKDLISFLKSSEYNIDDKYTEILKLFDLFKSNITLIPFFKKCCKRNNLNLLYESIFDIYLSPEIQQDKELILENLLKLIITNSSLPKSAPEYLYQKMSIFFKKEKEGELNEQLFMKYLNLLHLCYKDNRIKKEENSLNKIDFNGFEEIEDKKNIEIKNYMYFNGINSSLTLKINNNTNSFSEFPSIENGLSFVFWINLDKNIMMNYSDIYNLDNNPLKINFIVMNIAEHQIKFIFSDNKYFQLVIDKNESKLIDISSIFSFGKWVNICLIMTEKTMRNPRTLKVYINGLCTQSSLQIPNDFPTKIKINKIVMFENLIGKVSSVLFFSFPLEQKIILHFALHMNPGIYNNKILFKFLIDNDGHYFKNSIKYKYFEKFKNEKNKEKLFKILLKDKNMKNIISIFPPFSYNRRENSIDDIFGNYIATLSKNDGVNIYINHTKNIQIIGGISNLLPIAELMLKLKNSKNNIISEKSLLKYITICKDIIVEHNHNLNDANKNNFFSNLGLFLERFPSTIFNQKLLSILIEIGKETFQNNDNQNEKKKFNYINTILLNEKIFSKFNCEDQFKLWDELYKFFTSDYSKLKESLNMSKICFLLRFYDENRYNEYCCQYHSNIFKNKQKSSQKNAKNQRRPELNIKIRKLFEIIQMYINKFEQDEIVLYKLLLLDLSPCLQIKIIDAYINYFIGNTSEEIKKKTFISLIKNNYFEITEYLLTISLLDVRVEIFKLMKILFQFYRTIIKQYYSKSHKKSEQIKTIFYYIGQNLFINKLLVEIEQDKKYKDDKDYISTKKNNKLSITLGKRSFSPLGLNKKINKFKDSFYEKNYIFKDTIPLIKFINNKTYDDQKESLWRLLSSWIIYEDEKKNLKINNFAINFCLIFVQRNKLKYIGDFFNILIAYFNDNSIINNNDFYSDNKLFSWIIETIFYYHNKENIRKIDNNNEEEHIKNIQKKSLEILKFFLGNKYAKQNQFEKNISFIYDYSIYIKNKVEEENIKEFEKRHKKNEISRITGILLLLCLESFNQDINFMTKICFRFLLYYKNCSIIINKDTNQNNIENNHSDSSESDDSFEVVEKPLIKKKSILIINHNINLNDNENNNQKFNNNKDSLIPNYILEGINYDPSQFESEDENKEKEDINDIDMFKVNQSICNFHNTIFLDEDENKNKNKIKKNVLLKEIWKDFAIYDFIIDYYCANLWGLDNLCKKVNIEYDNNPIELIKKLYQEYSNNKKYKNILLAPVLKCLNIQTNNGNDNNNENLNNSSYNNKSKFNSESKNKNNQNQFNSNFNEKINILTINIILLSIAIEITNDEVQKEFLENQYQQFIIFCILASINIKSNEKNYNLIQNELYDILGYGCLFLKDKNETKYKQIFNYLINPIFKEINEDEDNKSFKKMFGFTKKKLYSNTAAFKVFSTKESKKTILKSLTIKNNSTKKSSASLRCNSFDDISSLIGNKLNLDDEDPNMPFNQSDKKLNKKTDDINDLVDIDNKTYEIMPELNVDKEKKINEIFNNIQNQYKKLDNKTSENIKKIIAKKVDEELLKFEKKRVFNEIKRLIPGYIEMLKKYSNTSNSFERLRKNEYKKMKIKLFSWRGFWSNKYLFFTHPEYLKLKVKNHYTKEMIRPILSPVYDIKYYLPKFKIFKKENLFNKNNYNYNINLNIDDILKEKLNNLNSKESFNPIKNNFGFNYLECLYKMQDKEIWNYYKMFYKENLNINKKIKTNLINSPKNKDLAAEKKDKKNIHSIECCMVKAMNHIKGHINIKKDGFIFKYDEYEEEKSYIEENNLMGNIYQDVEEDELSYDKEMGCCYGSLFKKHKRDKEKIRFHFEYKNIKYFFIRNYYYRDTAVEIFTEFNKSYFFNFKSTSELSSFISILENNSEVKFRPIYEDKTKKKLGFEKLLPSMKNKFYSISTKTEEWQNYNISTLEYLMWLNIYSGRSFNDLNQYPVFPWLITNYSTDKILKKDFRDLSQPIGMLELDDKSKNRKNTFINFYEALKNNLEEAYPDFDYQNFLNKGQEYLMLYKKKKLKIMKKEKNQADSEGSFDLQYTQIPYFYGTHYSNPTYISHYLVRVFPFSFISIEIHGNKFDDPQRMFFSLEKTFESVSTLKDDIREVIPEFYFMPEMFENLNNLDLAQKKFDIEGKEIIIDDVDLPPWSKNNSINFVLEMRKYLESDEININKWIDIIFGSYQRGENAEKINNIFMSYTYENMTQIAEIKNYDQRCALLRLYETGVTPRLLFKIDSKPRLEKSVYTQKISNSNLNFLEESLILDRSNLSMKNYNLLSSIYEKDLKRKIVPKITKIQLINNENVKIFSNTNHYYNFKTKKERKDKKEDKKVNDEKKIYNIENTSSLFAANYQISSIEHPIIIYNNNKLMIKGGFWDGRLEINSLQSELKEENISSMIFNDYDQPIVCMNMTEDENLLLCGTNEGAIIAYDVKEKNIKVKDIIYSHSDEITSISISDNLNMFATSSVDGYIMIHILPSLQLVRSIHISSCSQKLSKNNQNIINENKSNEDNKKDEENEQIYLSSIINNKENKNSEEIENIGNLKIESEQSNENGIMENIEISKIIEHKENGNNNSILKDINQFKEEPFKEYEEEKCLFANNIFLSSCPIPCIVVFIEEINSFRTYTINGEFINEIEEEDDSSKIYSPIVYKNINFHEFLIYGTNNGYIKIRAFPKMNLINKIKFHEECEIKTLALTNDKKYCYAWGQGDILSVISDNIIADFQEL